MNKIAKTFAITMTAWILKIFQARLIQSAKIEALKLYIGIVGLVRQLGILWIATASSLILAAFGFAMLHLGIIFLLYLAGLRWSIGWIVISVGLLYMAAGACFIWHLCSEKNWLKYSRATDFLAKLSDRK